MFKNIYADLVHDFLTGKFNNKYLQKCEEKARNKNTDKIKGDLYNPLEIFLPDYLALHLF